MRTPILVVLAICYALSACGQFMPEDFTRSAEVPIAIDFQGVWTNPNASSKVPAGAARYAQNLVNPRPGVASTVPGQKLMPGTYEEDDERLATGLTYDGLLVEHTSGAVPRLYRRDPGAGSLTLYSTAVSPPTDAERLPMAIAGEKLYMATSAGVKVMDGATDEPDKVGMPPPFAPYFATPGTLGSAFEIEIGQSVAYRAEIRRKDSNGIDIVSVPSGRTVVTNTLSATRATGSVVLAGGAGGVTVTIGGISVGPIAAGANDTATALDVATAWNVAPGGTALATVFASGPTLTWTAVAAGSGGNAITLVSSATAGSATASGATFSGGDDGDTAIITKNYLPADLVAGDEFRLYRTGVSAAGVDPGDTMFLVHVAFLTGAEITAKYHEWTDSTPDALRGESLYTNAANGGISRQNERPPYAHELTTFDDYLVAANVRGPHRFTLRFLAVPDDGDIITIAGRDYEASSTTEDPANAIFMVDTTSATVSQRIANTALSLVKAVNVYAPNTTVYAYYMSGNADAPGILMFEARPGVFVSFGVVVNAHPDRYEPPLATELESQATEEENGLWFSKRGQHYAFPPLRSSTATYRIRVGSSGRPILRVAKVRNNLIVFVDREGVWKVQRTGPETWRVDQINNNAHLLVPESVAVVDNQVIAWTTRGVVAIDETGVEEIDLPIKDQFEAIRALGTDVVLPYTFAVADEGRLRYILYHPESASDTTATHAWVYNADQGTWTERTDDASGGFIGEDDGLLYLGSADSNTLTQERTGTAANVYKRPDNTAIPVRLKLTTQDEGAPSRPKQYTDFFLLTREAITGSATFTFTNDFSGSESCTGSTSNSGEPFIHVWVPDGCQRTSRLEVDIQRNVLGQAFEVVGVELYAAGTYRGGLMR